MDKELTQEQKLAFMDDLEKTIGTEGLRNLLKLFNNNEYIKNNEIITEKSEEEIISDETDIQKETPTKEEKPKESNVPPVIASIYAVDALPLVEEDLRQREKELNNIELIKENNDPKIINARLIKDNNVELIKENNDSKIINARLIKDNNVEEIVESEANSDKEYQEEPFDKAPVLERKLTNNNPWSGIEVVSPGTLKL